MTIKIPAITARRELGIFLKNIGEAIKIARLTTVSYTHLEESESILGKAYHAEVEYSDLEELEYTVYESSYLWVIDKVWDCLLYTSKTNYI